MGSQDGTDGASARPAALSQARQRNTAGWSELCEVAPWRKTEGAASAPAEAPAAVSAPAPAPIESEVVESHPVIADKVNSVPAGSSQSLFEAFDSWAQLEGTVPSGGADSASAASVPTPPYSPTPSALATMQPVSGLVSFYAWVEAEGGLAAATDAVPAELPSGLEYPSEMPAGFEQGAGLVPVLVSLSLAPALPEVAPQPAPEPVIPPSLKHDPAPVLVEPVVLPPVVNEPPPPPQPVVTPAQAVAPVAMDIIAAVELAPVPPKSVQAPVMPAPEPAEKVVLKPVVMSAPKPVAKPVKKAKAAASSGSLLSSMMGAFKGLGFGGPAVVPKSGAPVVGVPAVKVAKGVPIKAAAPAKAKPPVKAKPVVKKAPAKAAGRGVVGTVEREIGFIFGAFKSAGSGLVRQAQAVVAPAFPAKSSPKPVAGKRSAAPVRK